MPRRIRRDDRQPQPPAKRGFPHLLHTGHRESPAKPETNEAHELLEYLWP
jgi:hypothetical protein